MTLEDRRRFYPREVRLLAQFNPAALIKAAAHQRGLIVTSRKTTESRVQTEFV